MKLVLATQNPKKLKEMNEILRHLGVEVVSEAELGVRIEVEETGETFTDNARLKATAVMQATGLPAVADDSGLCVDALNGGPGVYSARFARADRPRRALPHLHRLCVPERRRAGVRGRVPGHHRVRADGRGRLRLRPRILCA